MVRHENPADRVSSSSKHRKKTEIIAKEAKRHIQQPHQTSVASSRGNSVATTPAQIQLDFAKVQASFSCTDLLQRLQQGEFIADQSEYSAKAFAPLPSPTLFRLLSQWSTARHTIHRLKAV